MQILTGIYLTDGVSKSGQQFSIAALEDMVWKGATQAVPSNLSHDIHSFIGMSRVASLYIAPENTYVLGKTYLGEDENELRLLNRHRISYFKQHMMDRINEFHTDFFAELTSCNLIQQSGKMYSNGVVQYGYEGILYDAFPYLKELRDDDGLIKVKDLEVSFTYKGQGIFISNKTRLAILLHPYFRRSCSRNNNFNDSFLKLLFEQYRHNESLKVRLDEDFIGFAPSYLETFEFDYWYGPHYSDKIEDIQSGSVRYKTSETEKLYNQIEYTDFIWQFKDNKYQFEMEEVTDADSPVNSGLFECRYLHAFYNPTNGAFEHFDGAIRSYDLEKIAERLDRPINQSGHQAEYTKIFRLDGNIPLGEWKGLVTQYLKNNFDVYRYFGADIPAISTEEQEQTKNPIIKYVPYPIDRGDGVRVMVSYFGAEEREEMPRRFKTLDEIETRDGKVKTADIATVDFVKAMNRFGAEIEMPDCVYAEVNDGYNNIPQIRIGDDDTRENLDKTVAGIKQYISAIASRGLDNRYSFSLLWNIEDKSVSLSFMGHVKDLNLWLDTFETVPVKREGFARWVSDQSRFIKKHGRKLDFPNASETIKDDGVLFFHRRCVQKDASFNDLKFDDNRGGLVADLSFDDDAKDLAELLNDGHLSYMPICTVGHSKCNITGEDYLRSENIAVFGETYQELDGAKIQGFVWGRVL